VVVRWKGTCRVRANHDLSRVSVSFDETNLVPNAGLLPAAVLAERFDVAGLVDRRLRLARHGANSGAKALSVVGSILAGGDSIDGVAVLRAGAAGSLFDGTRGPSTVGSWLRAHTWSNIRQLDAISRELLARVWSAGAGPADLASPLTIDIDSTIVEVHGRAKQGAAFGYTKVRGYHPQLATCAQTGQVLMCRLRGGSAGAARGAASFLTETVSRVRGAGATGQLTVRADSAFYSKTVVSTAAKFDLRFSITVRQDRKVRAAIEQIAEDAWQPIPHWLSTPQVSGADIAETSYTCFDGDKRHARTVRLVVRRVRPTPGAGGGRRGSPSTAGSRGRRDPDGGAAGDGPAHPGGAGRGRRGGRRRPGRRRCGQHRARGRVRCRSGSASAGAGQSDSPSRRGPALAGRGGVEETATLTDLGGGDSDPLSRLSRDPLTMSGEGTPPARQRGEWRQNC